MNLPRVTKVLTGDQPPDSEHQIREMIVQFIMQKNGCCPSQYPSYKLRSLRLAKDIDPQVLRTPGVITQLDLTDEETDARAVLENNMLPLCGGYLCNQNHALCQDRVVYSRHGNPINSQTMSCKAERAFLEECRYGNIKINQHCQEVYPPK